MTFGISSYDGDQLADYRDSTSTGLAAALSVGFSASPSFEMSSAEDPALSAFFAGTGLSAARNVDVGALSYEQALNVAPPSGKMITLKQAEPGLFGFDLTSPTNWLVLGAAAYIGYKNTRYGLVLGPLAALGLMKLFEK